MILFYEVICCNLNYCFPAAPSEASVSEDENSAFGDFEDLQTGEIFSTGKKGPLRNKQDSDEEGSNDDEAEAGYSSDDSEDNDAIDAQLRQMNAAKKAASRLHNGNVDDEVPFS